MKRPYTSITIASSKGQIVIPKPIRNDMKISGGTAFEIMEPKKDIIVLKKIKRISKDDLRLLRLLEKSRKDLEEGKFKDYPVEEFFRRLKNGKL